MPISIAEVRATQAPGTIEPAAPSETAPDELVVALSTRFDLPYSYQARFAGGEGVNPVELLAAAHAGCFIVALTLVLMGGGHPPTALRTTARVHEDPVDGGFAITRIELDCEGEVSGIDGGAFRRALEKAKAVCPVSKALGAGAEVVFDDVRLRAPSA